MLAITPLYLTCLPLNNRSYYVENFDRYSDSYVTYVNDWQLDEILADMGDEKRGEVNERLIEAIGVKRRREGVRSACFGVSRLDVVRLKCHGNVIVEGVKPE